MKNAGSFSPQSPAPRPVTFSSFWLSLQELVESFLNLLMLEAKQAAVSLVLMLAFGVAAAVLVITGWLALVACIVLFLVQYDVVGWAVGLIIAAVLSFAGSAGLGVLLIRRSQDLLFRATRRQLARSTPGGENGQTS
jgi:hypothetical protein